MSSFSKKIDSRGNYLPYKGVTVICPLYTRIDENGIKYDFNNQYKALTTGLDPNKYSILPLESYHMTIKGIFSGRNNTVHFNKSLPQLRKLQSALQEQGAKYLAMSTKRFYNHGVHLEPATYEDSMLLSMYENVIDSVLMTKVPVIQKHMTFAYRYTDENSPPPLRNRVKLPSVLFFGPPVVCTFDDMTKYKSL
jgi:hypothetical protein